MKPSRTSESTRGAGPIDDLVCRREDANHNGSYADSGDSTWYPLTDVQFSVVAVINKGAGLYERAVYDAYGAAWHRWGDDVDGSGQTDSSDKTAVSALYGKNIGQTGYNADADLNRDGTISSADAALVSTKVKPALPSGFISDPGTGRPDCDVGYDG